MTEMNNTATATATKTTARAKKETSKSVFEVLSAIDVKPYLQTKGSGKYTAKYIAWADAWKIVKKSFPTAKMNVLECNGIPYFTDGRSAWVKVAVEIEGEEVIDIRPVLDYSNNAIALENVSSANVNVAIERSLVRACAKHGLGLELWGGDFDQYGNQYQPNPNQQGNGGFYQPNPYQNNGFFGQQNNGNQQFHQNAPAQNVSMQNAPNQGAQPQNAPAQNMNEIPLTEENYKKATACVLNFGEHKGQTLGAVMAVNRTYVEYLSKLSPSSDAEAQIQAASSYILRYNNQ